MLCVYIVRTQLYRMIQKDGLNHVVGRSFCLYTDSLFAQIGDSNENVETKTKRTLHSSRQLSLKELTNAENLVLRSSHFVLK